MATFPPPPTNTIDWPNLGFKVREVNGHVESTFTKATGKWSPLRFVADPYMRIHGMAPVINYGQQAFEGLKAFRQPGNDSIAVFRPEKNALRLQHSADVVSCEPVPTELFLQGVRAAIALNAEFVPPHETGAAMYLRPQVYGSCAMLGLTRPDDFTFCVYAVPTGVFHGTHPAKALILDEFDRAAPNGTGHAKLGGNYGPVLKWSDKARAEGYGITLHLDSEKHEEIDEFSTSGFIGAIVNGEDVTLVVPDSKCVIASVTSDSVQEIGRSFGWKVECRPINYTELPSFTEVMAAGTAAALVPIRSITRRDSSKLRDGPGVSRDGGAETVTYLPDSQDEAGPIVLRLLTQLQGIQLGKIKEDFGWRQIITEADLKVEGREANGTVTPSVGQMD